MIQDWLGQMYNGLDILQTSLTIGKYWMHLVNQGVADNGMTMEICTAYPRHVLTALEMNSVTIVSTFSFCSILRRMIHKIDELHYKFVKCV